MALYSQLFLRNTTSPYGDFTRNSVLSFKDLDQNFIFLKERDICNISYSSDTLTIDTLGGNSFTTTISGGTGTSLWSSNVNGIHYNSGNVGIGTGTPTEKLDVSGNTKISGTLNIGTLGTGTSVNILGVDSDGYVVDGLDTSPWSSTTNNSTILKNSSNTTSGNFNVADGDNNKAEGSYSRAGGFNTVAGLFVPEDVQTNTYPIGFTAPKGVMWLYLDIPFDETLLEALNTTVAVKDKSGEPYFGTLTGDGTEQYGPIVEVFTIVVGGNEVIALLVEGSNWTGSTSHTNLEIPIIFDTGSDLGYAQSHGYYTKATGRASFSGGLGGSEVTGPIASGDTSFTYQTVNNGLKGSRSDRSVTLGGENNDVNGASENSAVLGGSNNTVTNAQRSVILGGQNITGTTDDTVYVPNLNINNINSGTITNNLAIDSNNNVIIGGSFVSRREKIRYVDPVNGDNTSASANFSTDNFNNPYQTFAGARSDAQSGDLIVLRPGFYNTQMLMNDNVNVYCEPGVIINYPFQVTFNLTCKIYGHAYFTSAGLDVSGLADDVDVYFEFDKIDTTMSYAIRLNTGSGGRVRVKGNYISASVPIKIYNGNNRDVHIDIVDEINGFGNSTLWIGDLGTSPSAVMTGNITIKSSKVTSNSSIMGGRTVVFLAEGLRASDPNDYKVVIKTDKIVGSDAAANNGSVASCVWVDGGDNIHIYGDLIGKKAHAIASRGGGASYHTGTINFYNGFMSSDKAVVSSGQKGANGNGWHNLNFENCYFRTTAIGPNYGGGVIETTNNFNVIHGGIPGELFFNNCTFYNEGSGDAIFTLNQPNSPVNGVNANVHNSLLYMSGATGFSTETVQTNKTVNYFNTLSNVDNDTNILLPFSGISNSFAFNNGLNIPNKEI